MIQEKAVEILRAKQKEAQEYADALLEAVLQMDEAIRKRNAALWSRQNQEETA